jgi:hypothetical protein
MRAGGALGRLLPCEELPWPLLPAAALFDGPGPAPLLPALAVPLSFFCLPCGAPSTSCSERGGAHPCDKNAASRTPPNCTLWSPMWG